MRHPLLSLACLVSFPMVVPGCADDPSEHPVRATLDDGQVMHGAVQTELLVLETGVGTIEVPLADIGEVAPVEGGALGSSGDHVNVWLQNGTELVGRWAEPNLRVDIEVGGAPVPVDLPMEQLQRVQTDGGDALPRGTVYRVRTIYGDDVLIDPAQTRLELENDLGSFSPTLSECVSANPVAGPEGEWRLELATGTVLIGHIATDSIHFSLPMGPASLDVPLASLASLTRQNWSDYDQWEQQAAPEAAPAQALEGSGGSQWFDRGRQSGFKKSM